jgi:hypothetical protein
VPNITSTETANAIATLVAARALGYLKATTVAARLVNRDYENEVATHGKTVDIPIRGALTVNDKAENTAVTLQNPSTTKVSVTLDKHKEVSFLLEDVGRILARPALLQGYMDDGMAKLAEQLDADILALASSFTGAQLVDATSTFDDSTFIAVRTKMNKAKVPTSGRWAILSPDAEAAFLQFSEVKSRDYTGDQAEQAVRQGFAGQYRGFNVVMSQQVPVLAGTPNKDRNLFLHRDAITLVTRPLPVAPDGLGVTQRVMSEDGVGIRITMSYSPDHLGYQVTLDMLYGVAKLRGDHAVQVQTAQPA